MQEAFRPEESQLHPQSTADRAKGKSIGGARQRSLKAAAALALITLASGCGAQKAGQERLALRIEIGSAAGGGAHRVWWLRCDPAAGNWPRATVACRRLSPRILAPIRFETRDLVPITPRPVAISGTAFGRPVRLIFENRGSSTRRKRFESLSRALDLQPVLHQGRFDGR